MLINPLMILPSDALMILPPPSLLPGLVYDSRLTPRRVSCALLEVHQRNSLAGLCEEVWAMVASTTPAPTPTPSPAIGGTEGTVAASGRAGGALAPGPLPGPQQVQMAASLEGGTAVIHLGYM